jgi:hypothetical protein
MVDFPEKGALLIHQGSESRLRSLKGRHQALELAISLPQREFGALAVGDIHEEAGEFRIVQLEGTQEQVLFQHGGVGLEAQRHAGGVHLPVSAHPFGSDGGKGFQYCPSDQYLFSFSRQTFELGVDFQKNIIQGQGAFAIQHNLMQSETFQHLVE